MPDEIVRVPGIDVSRYQKIIDWAKVAEAGIKFVYIKVTEGATWQDPRWRENYKGAKAAGILVGAYHLWKALTSVNIDQVRWFRRHGVCDWDLPPALDVETDELDNLQDNEASWRVADWLDLASRVFAGNCVLYVSYRGLGYMRKPRDLYPLTSGIWLCKYDGTTPKESDVTKAGDFPLVFHQHSSSGVVPGIAGNCDLDWYEGDEASLVAYSQAWKYRPGAIRPIE